MSAISRFWRHTATVRTWTGIGAQGDVYAAPVTVKGFLDFDTNLSITAQSEQYTSGTRFFCALAHADKFTPGSEVTANGVVAQVVSAERHDSGGLGLPDHLEVVLR